MEQEINYGSLDVIGVLFSEVEYDAEGNVTMESIPIPGWHINSPWKISGWSQYEATPSVPRRVFAGAQTFFYSFQSKEEFESLLEVTDISAPKPIPHTVTRRQALQALFLAGVLDNVQVAIDAIPDPLQRKMIQIEWNDSQTFERNRPTLIGLATALGMSSADLDQLFITANSL